MTRPAPRHYLELRDLDAATLRAILDVSGAIKRAQRCGERPAHPDRPLAGRTLGLMLEKPSTRTRVSFEVAMRQLGGDVVVLSARDMQLGRGESIADTARVLSRFLDAMVLRTDDARKLRELVAHSTVPVINGLTADSHPVQLLADILTFEEHRGPIRGQRIAWAATATTCSPPGSRRRCASASICASRPRRTWRRRRHCCAGPTPTATPEDRSA